MNSLPSDVAIIGAGLAGTALALALYQQHIPPRLFESRAEGAPEIASGVILTPNGLRILDALGVFERIKDKCWKAEYRTTKNDRDETTKKTRIANEDLYGYKNHRIWRRLLLQELKLMLRERKIEIAYSSRYEGIVDESEDRIGFRINGKEEHAQMLVGADGIFSSVRKYIDPDVRPGYTGILGCIAHIHRDTVKWPMPDYEPACTIQGKSGALVTMPEDPEAHEIMVAVQRQWPDQTRAQWEALAADKDMLCEFFRKGYDDWHDTGKQIIDQVCAAKENIYAWPYMRMPKLKTWYSRTGRVVILGDAAHAVPPSSGQGVNQALEDVHSLLLFLNKTTDRLVALRLWQKMRETRIDMVYDRFTTATNVERMSEAERKQLIQEGKAKDLNSNPDRDDMRWLYQLNLEQDVASVVKLG